MTKSSTSPPDRSGGRGGIKPLNAPRIVHVRTDSTGTPVAVQVPPAIASQRRQRGACPPSLPGRRVPSGREGGLVRRARPSSPPPLVSDGRWVKVTEVEDLWKVNDEWWRGPEEEIARLYYTVRLENSQQLTVYLDLIANSWYRQTG